MAIDKFRCMSRLALFIALNTCLITIQSNGQPGKFPIEGDQAKVKEGVVIVKLKENVNLAGGLLKSGISSLDQKINETKVLSIKKIFPYLQNSSLKMAPQLARIHYFRFDSGEDPVQVALRFSADPNVDYAEPRYIFAAVQGVEYAVPKYTNYPINTPARVAIPDDPFYSTMDQFQFVHAPEAWDVVKGEMGDVVIGIVDTGTDWDHEDLLANVWTNPGEVPGNGIDDDQNGFIDDVHGWNFLDNSNDPHPVPGEEHGTHVAGVAAAVTNNGIGVAGISWNCRFMPINAGEEGYEGIVYAVSNGADIINCSWGWYCPYSRYEQDVINFAQSNGVLVVSGAANQSLNIDFTPIYPPNYNHVLVVGGTLRNRDMKWDGSNYGVRVDVSAPAVAMNSTLTGNRYAGPNNAFWSGNSQSSPFVAGLAALLKTLRPDLTVDQLREQIRVTCDNIDADNPGFEGLMGTGRVNALRAVTEFFHPSIRIVGTTFTDSGGDSVINRGDVVDVAVEFINYLTSTSNISITLREYDREITLINNNEVIPLLKSNETAFVTFQFVVDYPAIPGDVLRFITDISAGSYSDRDLFLLKVNSVQGPIPDQFSLAQNYPNPFNLETNIRYSLPNEEFVTLKVYDVLGREIATLVNRQQREGTYEIKFNVSGISSGIYFYRLSAGNFTQVKKMLAVK